MYDYLLIGVKRTPLEGSLGDTRRMSDDRKYKQSGYQDSDRPARERADRGGSPSGPREPASGPRGRGSGARTDSVSKCPACGARLDEGAEIGPASVCASCGKDLHTCTNCVSFEPSVFRECRLGGATLPDGSTGHKVIKKSSRNECVTFAAKTHAEFAREATREGPREGQRDSVSSSGRTAFDALFKK
jgi:hypothetical protein